MIGIGRPRRRYQALLRELGVRPPADVDALCKRLAARRGRPIVLRAYLIRDPGVYGMCMSTASTDFIFYEARTSRVHQDHIVLHELVHLVAGHAGVPGDDTALKTLFPSIAPIGTHHWLRRHSSGDTKEIEAEAVAVMALGWASPLSPRAWMRYWRIYRGLAPLWLVLRSVCPQTTARKPTPSWPPWQIQRRAYRRLIECHDGLVRIGQHLGGPKSQDDRKLSDPLLSAADMAGLGRATPWPAKPNAIPRSHELDADADALVSLSRAIEYPGAGRRHPRTHLTNAI